MSAGSMGFDRRALANELRSGLRLLDTERMIATEPPPVPWIAEPLLARGAVTMLVGREGQGKSLLALALAAAIGHGGSIAGMQCQPGRVVVIDAENGEAEAHRRVRALRVKPGTLAYVEAQGFDLRKDERDVKALLRHVRPDVLVLDSLRSLAPGLDENDSGPVEEVLGPLRGLSREYGCATLIVHHAGKANHDYRGSTAIGAAVELGFRLDRAGSDPQRRTLSCWKLRIAPEPPPRTLAIEAGNGRIAITEAEPAPIASRASETDELADRFAVIVAERGALRWGELCRLAGADPESGTSRRARRTAIERGRLVRVKSGVYGPPASAGRPHPIGEVDGRPVPGTDEERGA